MAGGVSGPSKTVTADVQVAATALLIVYVGVAVRWRLCYELYHISAQPTTHPDELERLDVWVSSFPML